MHANNFTDAFNALKSETGVEYTPDPKGKYVGLLEKKWTSVIRLQKKVRMHVFLSRVMIFTRNSTMFGHTIRW